MLCSNPMTAFSFKKFLAFFKMISYGSSPLKPPKSAKLGSFSTISSTGSLFGIYGGFATIMSYFLVMFENQSDCIKFTLEDNSSWFALATIIALVEISDADRKSVV